MRSNILKKIGGLLEGADPFELLRGHPSVAAAVRSRFSPSCRFSSQLKHRAAQCSGVRFDFHQETALIINGFDCFTKLCKCL